MSEHTKEPWSFLAGTDRDGEHSCSIFSDGKQILGDGIECSEVDARRIVACVNACAGISTKTLELGQLLRNPVGRRLHNLEHQCDQLLAALKRADSYYGITASLAGNGCEHGFKPAAACPNHDCEAAALQRAIAACT